MAKNFNYKAAIESGYTPDEIVNFLSENNPSFNVKGAMESGYSPEEIAQFMSENPKKEKSTLEKGVRLGEQFGIGLAESAMLPYEIAAAPLASEEMQTQAYRDNLMDTINSMMEQKQTGVWDETDENLLSNFIEQMKDPSKSKPFVQTSDVTVRNLAEKVTGQDLEPEGFLENTAKMAGFIKNPKNLANLKNFGIKPKEALKSILPSAKELTRAGGIAAGLEIAKDGDYGPIGTMGAMVLGDIAGMGVGSIGTQAKELIKSPKQYLAKKVAKFSKSEQNQLQKDLIESFRKEGIQADLGTITDNNLIRWAQARLSQSGLTGKALDEFKQNLFTEVKDSYKNLAETIGEAKYSSQHEAGNILKETLNKIREEDLGVARDFYKRSEDLLNNKSFVNTKRLNETVNRIEKKLLPGQIKSDEQKKVIDLLRTLKRDISDSTGKPMQGKVKDLINNKIALNDIINYEVQGGTKQLLKEVVSDLDRSIISHGEKNPLFSKNYVNANKRFSEHAKMFRNKSMSRLLREEDPTKILNKMNSVHGIKNIEKILGKSSEGKKVLSQLKRYKLDDIYNKTLINSTENQLKLGTFSNMTKGGKNREILKEMIGSQNLVKLEKIQKNAGVLNASAQKFFNASQSGSVATDAAIIATGIKDIFQLLTGNPWPLLKLGVAVKGAKQVSNLLADKEFLRLVEDVIIQGKKGSEKQLFDSLYKLKPYVKEFSREKD